MTIVKCGYKRFGHVWMTRILMVHYILKQGVDVFVMDTDAFPVRDPLHMINTIALAEHVDAIFGMGNFPPAAKKSWGFALCFGTAYFRSTTGTRKPTRCVLCDTCTYISSSRHQFLCSIATYVYICVV